MVEQRDRLWLFVILAYQNGFIDKDSVVSVMTEVLRNPKSQVESLLVEKECLTSEDVQLINQLVETHIKRHSGDTSKTLISLNAQQFASSLAQDTPEPDLFATLATELPSAKVNASVPKLRSSRTSAEKRYQIVRPHAEGGLGVVYAATDLELNRLIALKQIKEGSPSDMDSLQRFVTEAEITGGLEHPGIVPVYSFGVDEQSRPFYAMRLIQGESLKHAIDRYHALSSNRTLSLERDVDFRQLLDRFVSVCNTLAYAHNRGVIHRDIKPANIMLGPFGETLVVDWGLAKTLDGDSSTIETLPPNREQLSKQLSGTSASTTVPGSPIGTPAYMSPEQAAGDISVIGPASDIYGLGATLYTLLTGKPPLECRSVQQAIQMVRDGDVTPVRKLNPHVPPALAAICRKAMALKPSHRYQTPLELAADVRRWLADEPVSAHRDPVSTRAWRTLRKHRTTSSVVASVVLIGLIGSLIVSALLSEKNQQLAASNVEAETRLDQAMESYDGYVSGLYDQLQSGADYSPNQISFLLSQPQEFYEQLAEEIAAKDTPSEREQAWLAVARYNLALTQEMLGQRSAALTQYQAACSVYENLLSSSPNNEGFLRGLAASYNNLAVLQQDLGDPTQALSTFDLLAKVVDKQTELSSEKDYFRIKQFDLMNNRSRALEEVGKTKEAITTLETALDNLETQSAASSEPDVIYRLAVGRMNLGTFLSSSGQLDAAAEAMDRSVTSWKALAKWNPSSPAIVDGTAAALSGLGRTQIMQGDYEAAIESLKQAEERFRALAENQNAVPQFQQRLATTLGLIANAARNNNQMETATKAAEECVTFSQQLIEAFGQSPGYLTELANGYHALGLIQVSNKDDLAAEQAFQSAVEIRQKLSDGSEEVSDYKHDLGASLISLANTFARKENYDAAIANYKQAIDVLQKAVEMAPEASGYETSLATAWYELAQSYQASDQYENWINATDAYVEHMPDNAEWLLSAASDYSGCARAASDDASRIELVAKAKQLLERARAIDAQQQPAEFEQADIDWLENEANY